MPEGPEVAVFARGLQSLVGQTIKSLTIQPYKSCPNPNGVRSLVGSQVLEIVTYGKKLAIVTTGGTIMVAAGMSGYWRIARRDAPEKHDIMKIEGTKHTAVFNDVRRFGAIKGFKFGSSKWKAGIGPDGMTDVMFDSEVIKQIKCKFASSNKEIKPLLLDQSILSGIGNIYASEVCHRLAINPWQPAHALTLPDVRNICRKTHEVLNGAADGNGSTIAGANPHRTPDGGATNLFQLLVYGREGLPCTARGCNGTISKTPQAGRSTYHCPVCQPTP